MTGSVGQIIHWFQQKERRPLTGCSSSLMDSWIAAFLHRIRIVDDSLSSFLCPSSPQAEARLHHAEHPRDDAAGGAAGDPQHCQRLSMWQRSDLPGPRPLLRHPHHLGGALHQPGLPPPRHGRHQLVLRAPATAQPQDECTTPKTSICSEPEHGRDE